MRRPKLFALPTAGRAKPRWLAFSITGHAVFVALLLLAYRGFVDDHVPHHSEVIAIAIPGPPRSGSPPPPAAGRPRVTPTHLPAPSVRPELVAPVVATPSPAMPVGTATGVSGGAMGGHGLTMLPGAGDARLWVHPMFIPEGGGRPIDMDSLVRRRMMVMADIMDSIARNGGDSLAPYKPSYTTPSWTFESNGRTYGIDNQWIHLGLFKIPTALLALLPIPAQGNYDLNQHQAQQMNMRADILRAAARSEAEDDFRRAVAQIRERKDKERQEQRAREQQQRRDQPDDRPIP